MSNNESPTTAIRLPFPKVVCDECGCVCVWVRDNPDIGGEPWLQCTGCFKKRHNIGAAIEKQDRLLDSIEDTILELSAPRRSNGLLDKLKRRANHWFVKLAKGDQPCSHSVNS